MATENVNFPEHQADFIREVISKGRYNNVNEVIQVGVVLLEERILYEEHQKEKLGLLLDEALSGGVSDQSPQQIWEEVESKYQEEDA